MDISSEDKSSIEEALANHGAKVRGERTIMKLATKQWGRNLSMTGDKLLQFGEAVDRIPNTGVEDSVVFQLSSMKLTDCIIDQQIITTDVVTRKNVV